MKKGVNEKRCKMFHAIILGYEILRRREILRRSIVPDTLRLGFVFVCASRVFPKRFPKF